MLNTSFKHWLYIKINNISALTEVKISWLPPGGGLWNKRRWNNLLFDATKKAMKHYNWQLNSVQKPVGRVCRRKIWYIVGSLLHSLWLQMMTQAQDSSAGYPQCFGLSCGILFWSRKFRCVVSLYANLLHTCISLLEVISACMAWWDA